MAREFELLDRRLARDAGLVLLIGLGVTGGILGWAFWQLQRSHRLLARRTRDLQEANRELAQTARVASLGAVTAHLVHGLKNPVAGLQSFVAAGAEGGGADTGAWADALEATRRMQAMIQQVVRVVREEESGTSFEIPLPEFADAVLARARALGEARGVRVEGRLDDGRALDNRRSGLMALLVSNLMENAIQATPAGGTVRLNLRGHAGGWVAEVADEGPGIPEKLRGRLFQPVQSTKEGGSGLGLAITRQLASAMGGTVSLAETGERGSRFVVEIPLP